jgi:hypothetical protein
MNEDSPSGSPYETLAEHDQSETKHDMADLICKYITSSPEDRVVHVYFK